MKNLNSRQPVFFISHGGGPWPWMSDYRDTVYAQLSQSLSSLMQLLPRPPEAILMISAHWEETDFTVQTSLEPAMIYDYGGFPDYTYQIEYSARGSEKLSRRVTELLEQAGINIRTDSTRGYDHGMFSPMQVIRPEADIPVVQLSLKHNLDPKQHEQLGEVLKPLRDENILILGSGLSYHNLRQFNRYAKLPSAQFDDWLYETLNLEASERALQLQHWEQAPSARLAHPREEHLLPLMVVAGAAEHDIATRIYHEREFMGGLSVSSYAFGLS